MCWSREEFELIPRFWSRFRDSDSEILIGRIFVSRQNINLGNSSEFLSEKGRWFLIFFFNIVITNWCTKTDNSNQNRPDIKEKYQKSTMWNACAKLLSVCQLVILGLRKSALQKSCTARQQSVVPFGQKRRHTDWVRINYERSMQAFLQPEFRSKILKNSENAGFSKKILTR